MPSVVARVSEIHRYPVKSMQGERLAEAAAGAEGLRGDRAWAIRDEQRESIEGARKLPALLQCRARFAGDVAEAGELPAPEIELPGGDRVQADHEAAAQRLSELTGRPLSLWPRVPADRADHYRRGAMESDDMLEELRNTFARLPDEPLPDLGKFPPEILMSATLPGTYFDAYPFFLLTRTSLDSLAAANPASRFDPRRFRPNLLLDSEASAEYPENTWVGRKIRIGEAVLDVAIECPRCLMTTLPMADLPKDPNVMRTLVKENGGNIGVYASIDTPGIVREGDPVELLD